MRPPSFYRIFRFDNTSRGFRLYYQIDPRFDNKTTYPLTLLRYTGGKTERHTHMKAIITAASDDVVQYKDAIEKVFGEPVTLENEAYTVNCPYAKALSLMSKLEDELDALDYPLIRGFRISLIDEDSFFMEIEDTYHD
jgi:hypothetical protein